MVVEPRERACPTRTGARRARGLALALAPALLAAASCARSEPGSEAGPDPAAREAALQAAGDAAAAADAGAEGDSAGAAGRPVISPVRRPEAAEVPLGACSLALPLCAHGPAGTRPGAILAVIEEAERALRAYDALGLPRPLPDDDRGGGPAYDLYLAPDVAPLAPRLGQDLPALGERRDTASAFARVAAPRAPGGCAAASDVAYAIGHAIAVRLDAGASEGELGMTASYLAGLAAPCPAAELAAVDAFQRAPERAITGGALGPRDGALLFPWYLDEVHGAGQPGAVMLGLLALAGAGQETPAGAWSYRNEPDTFDALRASTRARDRTLDGLLLDFAVARAFAGSRSDGAHLADAARLGDAGRVRFEWSIPQGTLPRRVAPLRPVEPTGATYLWLDLSAGDELPEVTFVADWELGALFRWALVKVGRDGAEVGRVEVAGIYGDTRAERTVVGLGGLAGLLVVGVNAGSDDRSRPFDPDDAPPTPRGYTVWLTR